MDFPGRKVLKSSHVWAKGPHAPLPSPQPLPPQPLSPQPLPSRPQPILALANVMGSFMTVALLFDETLYGIDIMVFLWFIRIYNIWIDMDWYYINISNKLRCMCLKKIRKLVRQPTNMRMCSWVWILITNFTTMGLSDMFQKLLTPKG